jgi:polysaccharide chain length determinant protein (PEP-CTERM system associated)
VLPGKTYTVEEIVNIAWRRKWLILVPFVVCAMITAVVAHFLPNKYRSDTLMMVVPQRIPEAYVRSTVTTKIEDRLNSISQQILSRSRLERIVLDSNLYVQERKSSTMQDIVEQMRRDIGIEVIKGDAFRVSYVGNDPQTVKTVTERLASLFIEENVNERAQLAEGTNQFLQSQLENARARLAEQEARLEVYRKLHSGELPSQAEANLQVIQNTQMQIQSLLQSLNRDRDRKIIVESMLADLTAEESQPSLTVDPTGAASGGAPNPSLPAADQLVLAQAHLRALEATLTPAHPDVVYTRRQILELQKRAEAEALSGPMSPTASGGVVTPLQAQRRSRIKSLQLELESLTRQIAAQQAQERQLRGVAASYQARLEMVPARETELSELTRDYTTLKEIYADLLQKNEESKVAANLERRQIGEQFKLLDPARVPERPFSPNRPMINLSGAGFGLFLGLALVLFMEYRDTSFKTEDDINRLLGLPVLARIPAMITKGDQQKRQRRRLITSTATAVLVLGAGAVVWRLGVLNDLFR